MLVRSRGKKIGALAGVGAMLVLGACGSAGEKSADAGGGGASGDVPSWCGDKEVTLGYADGFGDNNWRRITRAEAEDEAKKCPNVKKVVYTDGQGDTQKAISDIKGLAAQGNEALIVFPDAGKAVLPALRSAKQSGAAVVPYRVFPGGKAGEDYDQYISTDSKLAGKLWAEWLVKTLKGKGNVLTLGGPPGNTQSLDEYKGMAEVLKDHPGIKLIGQQPYSVTNWDAAKTQQVITAALAKYPKIDAITTDFGSALASSFPAFKQANRKIPAVATQDSNLLSCEREKLLSANPDFQLFTVDSQNWHVRTAVQFAIADATDGKKPASTDVPQKKFEDSISGKPNKPKCDPSLGDDAILSTTLSKPQLKAALKN